MDLTELLRKMRRAQEDLRTIYVAEGRVREFDRQVAQLRASGADRPVP